MRDRIAVLVLIVALTGHVLSATSAFRDADRPATDFDRYYQIATGRGRPYVDYQVEHPIGTLLVFKSVAMLSGGRASFGRGIVATNVVADGVAVLALLWAWGPVAAAYYALVALQICGLLFNRIDFWSIACATVALAAWRRGRLNVAAIAIACGAALKLWPLVLAPALVMPLRGRRGIVACALFAATAAAFAVAALTLAGARAISEVLTFRGAHGWQIESLAGSLLHLGGAGSLRLENDAWRIGATNSLLSVAFFLAAAPVCLWSSVRGFRTGLAGSGWLASVTALLLMSALLSAQYVGWLIPGGAVAWREGDRRSALLAAAAVVVTQLFWSDYGAVLDGRTLALMLVVMRNAVLIAVAISAGMALKRTEMREASVMEPTEAR